MISAVSPDATSDVPLVRRTGRQWPALWRLEWLRLVRTHRLVALVATYAFLGATAAPMARYASDFVERFGGDVQVTLPPARPVDGFANYVSNATQLGLLVFVIVISSAVTIDSHPEMAMFLRTRVRHRRDLVLPRYMVTVAAGAASFLVGTLLAWWGTALLLGAVEWQGMALGVVLHLVYLAFIGAVAAALGVRFHSATTTAATTLGVALALAVVGAIEPIGAWLPSRLLGALSTLPGGGNPAEFTRSIVVALAATAVLLATAVHGARSPVGSRRPDRGAGPARPDPG